MPRISRHPPVPIYDGLVRADHTSKYLQGVHIDPRTLTPEQQEQERAGVAQTEHRCGFYPQRRPPS